MSGTVRHICWAARPASAPERNTADFMLAAITFVLRFSRAVRFAGRADWRCRMSGLRVLGSLSLLCICGIAFSSRLYGQQPNPPFHQKILRTWDDDAIRTLELLLAHAQTSSVYVSSATPKQTLSIHLYNEAQVNDRTLRWAVAQANRRFRMARIQINSPQVSAEPTQSPEMDNGGAGPQTNERPYIVMRVIQHASATAPLEALGVARPFAHAGTQIVTFVDRVEALARPMNTETYIILGHIMAHEIGHVLLHSSEHAKSGLMQSQLGWASWRLASRGLLLFRREEAERMKEDLARFQNCGDTRKIASNEKESEMKQLSSLDACRRMRP